MSNSLKIGSIIIAVTASIAVAYYYEYKRINLSPIIVFLLPQEIPCLCRMEPGY